MNTLAKFDTSQPMISMSMAVFLQAARSGAKDTWAEGETQPIHRSTHQPSIPSGALPPRHSELTLLWHPRTCRKLCTWHVYLEHLSTRGHVYLG